MRWNESVIVELVIMHELRSGFFPCAVIGVIDWECEELLGVGDRMFVESCFVGIGSIGREMDLIEFDAF